MKRFIILNSLRTVLTGLAVFILLGTTLQAQQGAEPAGDKEETGKAKVMVVKVIDGKTTYEEREIDLKDGEGMQIIEIDGETIMEDVKGGKRIIRKHGDGEHEVEVIIDGEGSSHRIMIEEDEIRHLGDAHGDGEHNVFITKRVEGDPGDKSSMKVHTIKVVNGDTVLNEISEGADNQMIWIEKGEDCDDRKVRKRRIRHGAKGKPGEEVHEVHVQVISDDGKEIVVTHDRIVSIFVTDLSEDETAKYAPAQAEALEVRKLEAFPNPNDGLFNLKFKLADKSQPADISINSLDGKEVYRETVQDATRYEKQIDLRDAPTGVYLLRILQGEQAMVKKLVIE